MDTREEEALDILIASCLSHDLRNVLSDDTDPDEIFLGPELSDDERDFLASLGSFQDAVEKCESIKPVMGIDSNKPMPNFFVAMNRDSIGDEYDEETQRNIEKAREEALRKLREEEEKKDGDETDPEEDDS